MQVEFYRRAGSGARILERTGVAERFGALTLGTETDTMTETDKDRSRRAKIMNTAIRYPRLSFDPDGTARIERSRYKVLHLAGEHYHYGWSAEEMLRQHPDLRPEQVYATLTYFYDHYSWLPPGNQGDRRS